MTLLLSLLLQASLCNGMISDSGPHPQSAASLPSLGVPYVDQAFGTTITRITDSITDPDPSCRVIRTPYSTVPVENSDGSYLLLWRRCRGHEVYSGVPPYPRLGYLGALYPTDIESILWDPVIPNVLYYPSEFSNWPILVRHVIGPGAGYFLQRDFSTPPTNCIPGQDRLVLGSDPVYMGQGPGKLIGLRCGQKVFLYSITNNQILWQFTDTYTAFTRTLMVAPSETYSLFDRVVIQNSPSLILGQLSMANFFEHGSLGRSDTGDVWNTVDFDGPPALNGTVVTHDLATTQPRVIMGPSTGWPYPPSTTHLSSIGPPGWVAWSSVGNGQAQLPLHGEVGLANVDTGQVCRIAHHRSLSHEGLWGYFSEPTVVLGRTGQRVFFNSDWGGGPVNTYVIHLP